MNILRVEENSFYAIEKRKWRYVILLEVKSKYSDHAIELLSKLAEVYADMNYPEDMEGFIHYHPSNNGCNPHLHSYEKNINRLCNLFQDFLVKEKQNIQNGLPL
ncbi:transcriptional regulator [Bacillus sp. A053]|nr:transcriptional regulator [Bacillus sp. A053]